MTPKEPVEQIVVMQNRCIYCKKEQYGPAVYDISHGKHSCVWCGQTPPVIRSYDEYWEEVDRTERIQ